MKLPNMKRNMHKIRSSRGGDHFFGHGRTDNDVYRLVRTTVAVNCGIRKTVNSDANREREKRDSRQYPCSRLGRLAIQNWR